MMVDGTYLERRGEKIISSDKKVSVTLGKREIGVSAMEDAEIKKKKQDERAKLVVDEKTLSELKSFGNEETKFLKVENRNEKQEEKTEEKKISKPKIAKAKFTSKNASKKTNFKNSQKKK